MIESGVEVARRAEAEGSVADGLDLVVHSLDGAVAQADSRPGKDPVQVGALSCSSAERRSPWSSSLIESDLLSASGLGPHTVTLAGEPTQAGLDGELQGQRVGSLMMFREAGIVVPVLSNISQADTPALALKGAEAFAQAAPR